MILLAIGFHITRREFPMIGMNGVLLILAAFVAYGRFLIMPF